jgi:uncharacterized protein involved in exopolysaccharide biosynthesis
MLKFIAIMGLTLAVASAYSIADAGDLTDEELIALGNLETASEQEIADLAAQLAQEAPDLADLDVSLDETDDDSAPEVAQFRTGYVPLPVRAVKKILRLFGRRKKPRTLVSEELGALSGVAAAEQNKLQGLTDIQRDAIARAACIRRNIRRCSVTRKVLAECINVTCKV